MKKITVAIIYAIFILILFTSCTAYEYPDGDTYQCNEPYLYLQLNDQQKTSYMEYNNKTIKVMFSIDIGGNFFINKYTGALYVSDADGVLNMLNGDIIVKGKAIANNEKGLLYLYPDTEEFPDFEEMYILQKVE